MSFDVNAFLQSMLARATDDEPLPHARTPLSKVFEPRPDPIPSPHIRTVQLVFASEEHDHGYLPYIETLCDYMVPQFRLSAVTDAFLEHATCMFPYGLFVNEHPCTPGNLRQRSFPTAQATLVLRSGFEKFLKMVFRAAELEEPEGYHPVILFEPDAQRRQYIEYLFGDHAASQPDAIRRRLQRATILSKAELVPSHLNSINRNARFGANLTL